MFYCCRDGLLLGYESGKWEVYESGIVVLRILLLQSNH